MGISEQERKVGNSVMIAWGKSRSFVREEVTPLLCQAPV